MKRMLLILSSLLVIQMLSAQSLVVEALDGTTQVYDMAAVKKLDFTTSGSMKVLKPMALPTLKPSAKHAR